MTKLNWVRKSEDDCWMFEWIYYDPMTRVLRLELNPRAGGGGEYTYHGIPPQIAEKFIGAPGDEKITVYNEKIKAAKYDREEADRHGVDGEGF